MASASGPRAGSLASWASNQVRRSVTRGLLSAWHSQPFGGTLAADARFDLVERGDPLQRLGRDRRLACGQVIETSAHMAPAEGERHRGVGAIPGQPLEPGIAVDLQHTTEVAQ